MMDICYATSGQKQYHCRLSVGFSLFFFFSFLIWFPKKQDLCDCALCLCLYLTTFAWRAVFCKLSMMGRNSFQVFEEMAEQSAAAE